MPYFISFVILRKVKEQKPPTSLVLMIPPTWEDPEKVYSQNSWSSGSNARSLGGDGKME